ncbi:hypothetical protein [Legionella israelensis]|uniref:HEAT repeat protein n=1 Tax=Legionella israelensis TaxID=454 RepID=A0A0W0V6W0_9GAMM|nr:hypothetical protein [Legionella israelensis]KTD15874.1 hypothetical protein Lisr_2261 [Legionella israelensis]
MGKSGKHRKQTIKPAQKFHFFKHSKTDFLPDLRRLLDDSGRNYPSVIETLFNKNDLQAQRFQRQLLEHWARMPAMDVQSSVPFEIVTLRSKLRNSANINDINFMINGLMVLMKLNGYEGINSVSIIKLIIENLKTKEDPRSLIGSLELAVCLLETIDAKSLDAIAVEVSNLLVHDDSLVQKKAKELLKSLLANESIVQKLSGDTKKRLLAMIPDNLDPRDGKKILKLSYLVHCLAPFMKDDEKYSLIQLLLTEAIPKIRSSAANEALRQLAPLIRNMDTSSELRKDMLALLSERLKSRPSSNKKTAMELLIELYPDCENTEKNGISRDILAELQNPNLQFYTNHLQMFGLLLTKMEESEKKSILTNSLNTLKQTERSNLAQACAALNVVIEIAKTEPHISFPQEVLINIENIIRSPGNEKLKKSLISGLSYVMNHTTKEEKNSFAYDLYNILSAKETLSPVDVDLLVLILSFSEMNLQDTITQFLLVNFDSLNLYAREKVLNGLSQFQNNPKLLKKINIEDILSILEGEEKQSIRNAAGKVLHYILTCQDEDRVLEIMKKYVHALSDKKTDHSKILEIIKFIAPSLPAKLKAEFINPVLKSISSENDAIAKQGLLALTKLLPDRDSIEPETIAQIMTIIDGIINDKLHYSTRLAAIKTIEALDGRLGKTEHSYLKTLVTTLLNDPNQEVRNKAKLYCSKLVLEGRPVLVNALDDINSEDSIEKLQVSLMTDMQHHASLELESSSSHIPN